MADIRRKYKGQLYSLIADMASALANPHRLEILDLLVQAPRTVDELARECGMSMANTSQHLQNLKRARLVLAEWDGNFVRYQLYDPLAERLWLDLRMGAEQQFAEMGRLLDHYREYRHKFAKISPQLVLEGLQKDDLLLIDTRPEKEYRTKHIPGAISIPVDELGEHLDEIPQDREIVAFCRGPLCVFADEVLGVLKQHGFSVRRLEEGVAEWESAGLPLETSEINRQ